MKEEILISLRQVEKKFRVAGKDFFALKDISLEIPTGTLVAITGKSGSGKSTLLNLMAGIDRPNQGQILMAGQAIEAYSEDQLDAWRGKHVGIVFQFFQLLPTLTILENVILPMDFCRIHPQAERHDRALQLLRLVGIEEQAHKFPATLSGGQQQRAALARALANDPPLILADEPTGNLDSLTAHAMFDLFQSLTQAGKTIVIVTHEREFTAYFERVIAISDGQIQHQSEMLAGSRL